MPEGDDNLEPAPPAVDPAAHADLVLKVALLEAGVDLKTEQGMLVQQAWEGKTPDPDAIARQWNIIRPNAEPEPEPVPERIPGEEGQAEERRRLAASSTIEPEPTDVDPREQSLAVAREVLAPTKPGQRSGTQEDAVATAFHLRAVAGGQGDDRVFVR